MILRLLPRLWRAAATRLQSGFAAVLAAIRADGAHSESGGEPDENSTETYATKEGTSITRQTGEVEWTAIKRTSDGRYQAVADEGENGFTAEKAAVFLNTVYTPVFTTSE